MSWWVSGAVLLAGVGQTVVQKRGAEKAESAQKKSDQAKQRIEQIRARNEKARMIQEMQIKQAQAASQAEAEGSSGSSAVSGVQASLTAQAGANIGMVNTQLAGAKVMSYQNKKAQSALDKAQFQSNLIGAAASAGSAFASRLDQGKKPAGTSGSD